MKTQRGFYESAQHEVNSGIAVFTVSIRVYNNNNNDFVVVVVVKNTRLVAFPIKQKTECLCAKQKTRTR